MKSIVYLFIFLCPFFALAQETLEAQETQETQDALKAADDASSKVGGIYFNNDKMSYSRIIGQKVGNIAGAYFSMGLSGAKRNLQIEGKSANLKISEGKPQFTVVFSDNKKSEVVFSSPDMIDYLFLVKLKTGKHERKLQNGSYGLTGIESDIAQKYIIPITIEKIDEAAYSITPKEELQKGEYGFYFNIPKSNDEDSKGRPFNGIFDFSIVK